MNVKWRRLWTDGRYGRWRPVRMSKGWTVVKFRCGVPVESDAYCWYTKREAEGVAALNNDARGLPL